MTPAEFGRTAFEYLQHLKRVAEMERDEILADLCAIQARVREVGDKKDAINRRIWDLANAAEIVKESMLPKGDT